MKKIMASVFWDYEERIYVGFIKPGTTINGNVTETLINLKSD